MIYRFFMRVLAKGRAASGTRQRHQFDPNNNGTETNRSSRKKNLDQIEDAEYEDITEKEKK